MHRYSSRFILTILNVSLSLGNAFNQQSPLYFPGIPIDSIVLLNQYPFIGFIHQDSLFTYNLIESPKKALEVSERIWKNDSPKFYLDKPVHHSVAYNKGYLFNTDDGLYYTDGKEWLQMHLPIDHIIRKLDALSVCDDRFVIVQSGKAWIWDPNGYFLKEIPSTLSISTISKTCDEWGYFWISDGQFLQATYSGTKERLPFLELQSNDISEFRPVVHFKIFHPEINRLEVSYSYNNKKQKSEWTKIDFKNPFFLSREVNNEYSLLFRTTVNQSHFQYADISNKKASDSSQFSWIVQLLLFGCGWILIAVIFIYREKVYHRRSSSQKESILKEWEIERLKANTARLQMNPHFIFNALQSIYALINIDEPKKAKDYLQRFSQLLRSVLEYGDLEWISLERELHDLENYLYLEQLTRNGRFNFEIDTFLDTESMQIPPMILQPIAENAIIHGFKSLNHKGYLQIRLKKSHPFLLVEIIDNGVGRERATDDHRVSATRIIKDRLQKTAKFNPGEIEIIDLLDQQGQPTGTKVILKIPFRLIHQKPENGKKST
ncbi:MAG TPA: histidine kinase [Saprospiraceae bacterium]|nr:histidine kinase [Saprospiraceae bacterium]